MIGYCVNGYRLWSPEDNKILLGKDVIFDETKFELNDTNESFYPSYEVQENPEKKNKEDSEVSQNSHNNQGNLNQ